MQDGRLLTCPSRLASYCLLTAARCPLPYGTFCGDQRGERSFAAWLVMLCVSPPTSATITLPIVKSPPMKATFALSTDHAGARATPGGAWMTRRVFVPKVTTTISACCGVRYDQ